MKKIILTNRISWLESNWTWSEDQPLSCFIPKDTRQTEEVAQFLKDRPDVSWIDHDQLFQQKRDNFEQDYVKFMAQVNINNHSFVWWTMNFTTKNPLSTDIIFKVFCFFCVVGLADELDGDLLVITEDLRLCRQLQIWSKDKEIQTVNCITNKRSLKDW